MRYILALVCVVSVIAAGFAMRSGLAPEAPKGFQSMIAQEVPGLENGGTLEKAERLLGWAANTADYASDSDSYRTELGRLPAHKAYTEYFARDAGGGYCGAQAVFYKNVLHLFGIDAFTVDFGTLEPRLTHVTVIVPHKERFYIFDPTFAVTFRDGEQLVPVSRLLAGGISGVEAREMSLANRDYLFSKPGHSFCDEEATKDGELYSCRHRDSFMRHYLRGYAERLKTAGIPVGVETIPALMRKGFFSVGPSLDPESRERFLALLAEHDIPMK